MRIVKYQDDPASGRSAKVLLLNQFFHPDLSATSQIATELAEDLGRHGFSVTALAGRGSYLGGASLAPHGEHRGIRVRRVATTSLGKRSVLRRGIDYGSFYAAACVELLRMPRQDVIVSLTTPPLIAASALPIRALRGSKLVYWVQDLYPEVAIAFGALRARSVAARAMAGASRFLLGKADRVVVLGDAMRERVIGAGAPRERVAVIPNWSDARVLAPVPHEANPLRADLAAGARCVVMYSGNMGRGHDMETLLQAARLLRGRRDIRFVFQGDGARRGEVEQAARDLPNVGLAPYRPRSQLAASLSAGDVHLICLSAGTEGLMEPSKLYGIMAVGRPALFVGSARSEVARTLLRERCGVVVASGDAAALAAEICSLADDAAHRAVLGSRARAALVARYTREVATRAFCELLSDTVASDAPAPAAARIRAPARAPATIRRRPAYAASEAASRHRTREPSPAARTGGGRGLGGETAAPGGPV